MQLNGEIPEEDLSQSTDSEIEGDVTPTMKENEEPQLPTKNLKNANLIEEDKKTESKEESEKFTDHSVSLVAKLG